MFEALHNRNEEIHMELMRNGYAVLIITTAIEFFHLQTSPKNIIIVFACLALGHFGNLFELPLVIFGFYKAYGIFKTQEMKYKYYMILYVYSSAIILMSAFPFIAR